MYTTPKRKIDTMTFRNRGGVPPAYGGTIRRPMGGRACTETAWRKWFACAGQPHRGRGAAFSRRRFHAERVARKTIGAAAPVPLRSSRCRRGSLLNLVLSLPHARSHPLSHTPTLALTPPAWLLSTLTLAVAPAPIVAALQRGRTTLSSQTRYPCECSMPDKKRFVSSP